MKYLFKYDQINEKYDFTSFIKDDMGNYSYTFKGKDDLEFIVNFENLGDAIEGEYARSYDVTNYKTQYEELGTSDAIGILRTVTDITVDFLKNIKPTKIYITHVNTDAEDKKYMRTGATNKRAIINKRFLERDIPSDYAYQLRGRTSIITNIENTNITEGVNYGNLYHIIDNNKFKFIIDNDKLSPYIASNSGKISFTRNKMMNSYLGDAPTSFLKLEIDASKLSNNYKISPFRYKSHNNGHFDEWEEMTNPIKNISRYVTKLIINKNKIENLKKSVRFENNLSDYFTTKGTINGTIPSMMKYIIDNSPYPVYVQDGSVIKKDDVYIQSLINFELKKVEFRYELVYRGYVYIKNKKGSRDSVLYSNGEHVIGDLVVGIAVDKKPLKTMSEVLDINIDFNKQIRGEEFTPYIFTYRIGKKLNYLENIIYLTPNRLKEVRVKHSIKK